MRSSATARASCCCRTARPTTSFTPRGGCTLKASPRPWTYVGRRSPALAPPHTRPDPHGTHTAVSHTDEEAAGPSVGRERSPLPPHRHCRTLNKEGNARSPGTVTRRTNPSERVSRMCLSGCVSRERRREQNVDLILNDAEVEPLVFAIVPRRLVASLKKERYDLVRMPRHPRPVRDCVLTDPAPWIPCFALTGEAHARRAVVHGTVRFLCPADRGPGGRRRCADGAYDRRPARPREPPADAEHLGPAAVQTLVRGRHALWCTARCVLLTPRVFVSRGGGPGPSTSRRACSRSRSRWTWRVVRTGRRIRRWQWSCSWPTGSLKASRSHRTYVSRGTRG